MKKNKAYHVKGSAAAAIAKQRKQGEVYFWPWPAFMISSTSSSWEEMTAADTNIWRFTM